MRKPKPYIHRDISWLSFNYRVLQEAKDSNVPLYERIKFLAIYSSNLGEFFRVRVSNHKNLIRAGKKTLKNVEFEPNQILRQISKVVNKQQEEFSQILHEEIIPELKKEKINIVTNTELNEEQTDFVTNYFNNNLIPYIQPILLSGDKIKPFLQNGALYLGVYMKSKEDNDKEKYYAIVKVPSDVQERFIVLPSKKKSNDIILLDDLVREIIPSIFPGFKIIDSYSIKLTRDAELYIDDEYSGDLLSKIKKGLKKRDIGLASRLVYDRTMPQHFIDALRMVFELSKMDLHPEGRYHNNFDFMQFPDFEMSHLKDISLPPMAYSGLRASLDYYEALEARDHLLYFPYHSFDSVVRFFQEAAVDPAVTHIKLIQYRVAKNSQIMDAIIQAVKNGKQVTAFIEIKARFDEEANLSWGEKLEAHGVNVIYSFPGLKVHSKLAMVRRVINGSEKLYAYFGTGNFNEVTAKIYTDFGLFTTDKKLLKEAEMIFNYLETKKKPNREFEYLGVGSFRLKDKLKALIKKEISNAKKGKEAYMQLKMNSLQDTEMIDLLYEASQAGVKIDMVVRGICCLVPGVKNLSENIHAISIVDKFLEHARVFIFCNDGDEKIYLSSADWMVRNLHYRIETMVPVFDEYLKYIVKSIMKIQLSDNVKARFHNHKNSNKYKTNDSLPVRSQYDIYYFIKRRVENII